MLDSHDGIFVEACGSGDTCDGVAFRIKFLDHSMLFSAFMVLSFEGAVEVAVLAVKFLLSVFCVTVFAQVGALAASAGEGDHDFSLSVLMWTIPETVWFEG